MIVEYATQSSPNYSAEVIEDKESATIDNALTAVLPRKLLPCYCASSQSKGVDQSLALAWFRGKSSTFDRQQTTQDHQLAQDLLPLRFPAHSNSRLSFLSCPVRPYQLAASQPAYRAPLMC